MIGFLEKGSEAKEKTSFKKTRQEMTSSEGSKEEVRAELDTSEQNVDSDNGSMRSARRSSHESSHRDVWMDHDSREERNVSFEEKLRSFKKQSEERLLHIKRSREAKIGKKKMR